MTAEVAILNKLAVALAADSTVTISSAREEHKTFETADKLFELCSKQPIGVMFYGNGQFMDLPISILIKQFRSQGKRFKTVSDAKSEFLEYLYQYGKNAPKSIQHYAVLSYVAPTFDKLLNAAKIAFTKRIMESLDNQTTEDRSYAFKELQLLSHLRREVLTKIKCLEVIESADFEGGPAPDTLTDALKEALAQHPIFNNADEALKNSLYDLAVLIIKKRSLSGSAMGLVFAGFGDDELLPSLHSCDVYGFLRGRLKYVDKENCDIDREGSSAAVLGFAQRDVMERFLFGFDDFTKEKVTEFAEGIVGEAADALLDALTKKKVDSDLVDDLRGRLKDVTEAFSSALENRCFAAISGKGRDDIEDMIRFMPKPDLAEMAESLVNLTSIRRRVSKGMETVGGPVDVAVISKAEGFIWVKRKHYFKQDRNHRFFFRNRTKFHPIETNNKFEDSPQ